jgi:hypothetical protein
MLVLCNVLQHWTKSTGLISANQADIDSIWSQLEFQSRGDKPF